MTSFSCFYGQLPKILWTIFLPSFVLSTTCVQTHIHVVQTENQSCSESERGSAVAQKESPLLTGITSISLSELLNSSRGRHSQPGSAFVASSLPNTPFFYKTCLCGASAVSTWCAEMITGRRNNRIAFCILEARVFKVQLQVTVEREGEK